MRSSHRESKWYNGRTLQDGSISIPMLILESACSLIHLISIVRSSFVFSIYLLPRMAWVASPHCRLLVNPFPSDKWLRAYFFSRKSCIEANIIELIISRPRSARRSCGVVPFFWLTLSMLSLTVRGDRLLWWGSVIFTQIRS